VHTPIVTLDAHGHSFEWNRMIAHLLGYTKDEVTGRSLVLEFIATTSFDEVDAILAQAIQGVEGAISAMPMVSRHGEHIELMMHAMPRKDADGRVCGVICVGRGRDLAEHREAIARQLRSDDALRSVSSENARPANDMQLIIGPAYAPIVGIDAQGRVTEWNPAVARRTGHAKEAAMGELFVQSLMRPP